jgi:hypothetical protein
VLHSSRATTALSSFRAELGPAAARFPTDARADGSKEEGQLEGFCEADEIELRGDGKGFGDVLAVESAAEEHVSQLAAGAT